MYYYNGMLNKKAEHFTFSDANFSATYNVKTHNLGYSDWLPGHY